jgi:hypothetical protein
MTIRLPKNFGEVVFRILILGISAFFITFAIMKAARAAITGDELGTYFSYLTSNIPALFNFGSSANNHVLNTLLAKIFSAWAGTSELVLRLPNLLAYVAFLLFSFLILRRFVKNRVIVVCGLLLLNLNPYVLDFFSLCRGYGLSLGFLMPALFFFITFLEKAAEGKPGHGRPLQLSLATAALAVLSYLGLLNVYLSLVVLGFVFLIVMNILCQRRPALQERPGNQPKNNKIIGPALILLAMLFNLLVGYQDLALVKNLFESVTVRIPGLNEEDRQNIQVLRVGIQDQEEELRSKDDLWRLEKPAHFTAIKFLFRPEVVARIRVIEISIGEKTFPVAAADIQNSMSVSPKKEIIYTSPDTMSLKRSALPKFKPAINWRGDRLYFRVLFLRLLLIMGIAALVSLFVLGADRLLKQWKILTSDQFRPLAWTTLMLGAFIGYPLFILRKSGEFYYGGRAGFIPDTVFSLIHKSFYGRVYVRGQDQAVFILICLSFLCGLIVLFLHWRKKSIGSILPGLALMAILVLTAASTLVQKTLLQTAYLSGRTALFFIPLFMLLLIVLFHDLGRLKPSLNIVSMILLVIVTVVSVFHFCLTANTTKTREWAVDADTKSMLSDLEQLKNHEYPPSAGIRLGVSAGFNASVRYYIQQKKWTWLEVRIAPPYQGNDYDYLGGPFDIRREADSAMTVVKQYPFSGTILLRPKPK